MDTQVIKDVLQRMVRERDALKGGVELVDAILTLEHRQADLVKQVAVLERKKGDLENDVDGLEDVHAKANTEAQRVVGEAQLAAEGVAKKAEQAAKAVRDKVASEVDTVRAEIEHLFTKKNDVLNEVAALQSQHKTLTASIVTLEETKTAARKALGV